MGPRSGQGVAKMRQGKGRDGFGVRTRARGHPRLHRVVPWGGGRGRVNTPLVDKGKEEKEGSIGKKYLIGIMGRRNKAVDPPITQRAGGRLIIIIITTIFIIQKEKVFSLPFKQDLEKSRFSMNIHQTLYFS